MGRDDQAENGGDWRVQLGEMRTWAALRDAAPDADAVARLSDRSLIAAAQNPDHSEAGRGAVIAELAARRLRADPWRLAVPSFLDAAKLARKGERLFFGAGRAWRVWSGWAFFLVCVAALSLAALPQTGMAAAPSVSVTWLNVEIETSILTPLIAVLLLGALLIWFFSSAFRRHPARILFLNKAGDHAGPLARMLSQELRPYGHILSLSDRGVAHDRFGFLAAGMLSLTNPLEALWFFLGIPVRFIWRLFDRSAMGPAVVLNARDYRHLARRLRDRIGLNMQAALSSKEMFPVHVSPPWRPLTARLLATSSDAIVVDLSAVAAWEFDAIREDAARCVFVALWGRAEEAQAALAAHGFAHTCFYYAPDGEMQRRGQFRAALLAAMRAAHGA